MTTSPIPYKDTTVLLAEAPANGHRDHQSAFTDRDIEFRYLLPYPIIKMEYGRVHRRKSVWSPVG